MDFASNGSYGAAYLNGDKTYYIDAMVRAREKLVVEAVSEHNNSYKSDIFDSFWLCFFDLELL